MESDHRMIWPTVHKLARSPAALLALGSLLLLTTANALLLIWPTYLQIEQQWYQQGEQLAAEYAHRSTNLLTLDDRISLTVEAQRWARQDTLLGIEIADPQGRVITASGQTSHLPEVEFSAALYYEDSLLGNLTLWQNPAPLVQARWRNLALLAISTALLAGLGWLLWRRFLTRSLSQQTRFNDRLCELFPALQPDPTVEPDRQAERLREQFEQHYHHSLLVVHELQQRLDDYQLAEIYQRFQDSRQPGEIADGALLKIDLLNLDALEGQLTAATIKQLLDSTRQRCEDVMRLYHGETTQDPWQFLVRDHTDEGDFIQRTLCAAYVLNSLLRDHTDWALRPRPEFSLSIMAGPLYVGIQTSGGLPVRTVFGQAQQDLDALSTHNRGEQILVGEPVFRYAALGDVVEAEIYRDVTLPGAESLEVWRLSGFADNWLRVLDRQVQALRERF